jgi:gamma-glutamyltranspeptidase/glutathione hydrolase
VHTVTECAKLAFADREKFYGDPAFVDVPFDVLLSDDYNDARRALIGDTASFELRPGDVPGFGSDDVYFKTEADIDMAATRPAKGFPAEAAAPGETVHLDIGDRFGNLVSVTPSGGWCKASPVIPALGFMLGTRAQMFWLEDGLPNSLEPRKRPRTTLSPSLARRDGEVLSFGTPGGDQQDQWSLVFFLHHVLFEPNLQAAIDLPMFHSNHFPRSFYPREAKPLNVELEARFAPAVINELRERGHDVDVTDEWSLGRLSAASRDVGGTLRAAANPRGMQGYAVGR